MAYEQENDPDGVEPDSNPFGLAFDGFDALVADAGGNALLRVTPTGDISVEAVFPERMVIRLHSFRLPARSRCRQFRPAWKSMLTASSMSAS